MSDHGHDRRRPQQESEQSAEQRSSMERDLELYLPEMAWQNDRGRLFNFTPKKERHLTNMAEQFAQAEKVIVPVGVWGLGDSFMHLRYAIHLAKSSNKEVICQVQSALLPFAVELQREVPNIQFVTMVKQEDVADPRSFLVRYISGGGRLTDVEKWVAGDPQKNLLAVRKKMVDLQTAQLEDLTTPELNESGFPDIYAPVMHLSQDSFNITDYSAGLLLQTLGVDVTAEDVRSTTLFAPTKENVEAIAQDLDYILVPDAKEMSDDTDFQSLKALPLFAWRAFFARVPKDKKIGIVMGISHPQYCEAVIQLAHDTGVEVEIIKGSLHDLAYQYLRAKQIVGVDSGTTHLARDVQVAAKKHGREIGIKPFFNESASHFPQYGIVDNTSFVSSWITSPQQTKELNDFLLR